MTFPALTVLASIASALIAVPYSAVAAPVTLQFSAIQDTTLFDDAVDASNGAGAHFHAGYVRRGGFERRALVRFDLGNFVPEAAKVISASLRLYVDRFGDQGDESFSLHRLTNDWGEGTSDNGGIGQGAPATRDDATWTTRFVGTPGTSWLIAGGDFVAAPSASAGVLSDGYVNWVSPTLIEDIDQWRLTPASNHGWLLKADRVSVASVRRFASSETAVAERAPQLSITYETRALGVPEPGTSLLFAGVLAAAASGLRKVRTVARPFLH